MFLVLFGERNYNVFIDDRKENRVQKQGEVYNMASILIVEDEKNMQSIIAEYM